jgi:hypothetical protein
MSWITDLLGVDLLAMASAVSRRKAINFGRSFRLVDDSANNRATVAARWPSVGPLAWVQFHIETTTVVVDAHEESWNLVGTGVAPTVTRTSAGLYTVTYPTTYTDELGATQSVSLRWGLVAPTTIGFGAATKVNGYQFTITTKTAANAAADYAVSVAFW